MFVEVGDVCKGKGNEDSGEDGGEEHTCTTYAIIIMFMQSILAIHLLFPTYNYLMQKESHELYSQEEAQVGGRWSPEEH